MWEKMRIRKQDDNMLCDAILAPFRSLNVSRADDLTSLHAAVAATGTGTPRPRLLVSPPQYSRRVDSNSAASAATFPACRTNGYCASPREFASVGSSSENLCCAVQAKQSAPGAILPASARSVVCNLPGPLLSMSRRSSGIHEA